MAITYDQTNKKVVVTGFSSVTPAVMLDLWTADTGAANGRQLYTGVTNANPFFISLGSKADGLVTTQPWCADSYGVQLKITCTARAGATLALTGKDRAGQAVTETGIDISTGSATSTKKFYSLDTNGIVFTGLTNGDSITIKQDRWGVISKLSNDSLCANINSYWKIECNIRIGNGSTTPGYFSSTNQLLFFAGAYKLEVLSNPVSGLYIGSLVNGYPAEGSIIMSDAGGTNLIVVATGSDVGLAGTGHIYNSSILNMYRSASWGGCYSQGNYVAGVILKGIKTNSNIQASAPLTADDINIYNTPNGGFSHVGGVINNIQIYNAVNGEGMFVGAASARMVRINLLGIFLYPAYLGFTSPGSPMTCLLIDCVHIDTGMKINGTGSIYRATYFNMVINNILGNPISGVLVTIKDKYGNIVSYDPTVSMEDLTINGTATSIVHASLSWFTRGFNIGDVIVIDFEFMLITNIGGAGNKTATVTRGHYSQYPACSHLGTCYKISAIATDLNGSIPQQVVALKRYSRTSAGSGDAPQADDYKDHTINITKDGYTAYQDVITFIENRLTGQNIEIALQPKAYIDNYLKQNLARIG